VGIGEEHGEQAADRRHSDINQDEAGPLTGTEHGVENDEDDHEGNGKDDCEALLRALLARILAGPIHVVASRQIDLLVDFGDRLLYGAAKIAATDAVLNRNVTLSTLAIDLSSAILRLYGGELSESDALSGGREKADVLDRFGGVAIGSLVANGKVVVSFALQDLAYGVAAHGRLNSVLDVRDVDAIAGRGLAIYREVEIWLSDDTKEAEVLHAANTAHDADYMIPKIFEGLKVLTIDFDRELSFDTTDGFLDVVGDRLREVPDDARNLRELTVHGSRQFIFVLV
jgi:hypothetical protein